MGRKWVLVFLVSASLIFAYVIAEQWITLKEFPEIVLNYSKYKNSVTATFENSLDKFIGQCTFYLLGISILISAITTYFRRKELNRTMLRFYVLYFLVFVALELPLYGWDIGWETVQGHSFWKGFHFH
ncbi:hypothetical protein GCM10011405_33280 [Rufibacter glacialis]|uniref:Uncharacterized protein n=1 Tax=Rufibacter glacialis TaxID=1259555 RepID=A0A5M8QAR1_9BACT|nr:hypothetical protein FOE74_16040 [Rufibacter glacialis]GGK82811.1 hypothetical protein GCM10011405_33280 [Rufibacter glacialis]